MPKSYSVEFRWRVRSGKSVAHTASERGIGKGSLYAWVNQDRIDHGEAAGLTSLEMDNPPDAIFLANNRMTTGVFHALLKYKIAIPEQISLVGFDELPWVDIVTPTITTVRQPTYEMGMAAANKLLERFHGDESEPEEIVFDPDKVGKKTILTHPLGNNISGTIAWILAKEIAPSRNI